MVLLLFACALASAAAAGIPALAQTSQADTETNTTTSTGGIGPAVLPEAEAASARTQRAYRRWREKLDRHDISTGRDLVAAAVGQQRPPAARELRRAIRSMRARFSRFLRSAEGRALVFRYKVKRIPAWGRQQLAAIAACESHGNPRAVGGGGIYRGMYQFSFGTWQIVGGTGDPATASRHEQTWRAWLLLSRHGAGHWPVCT